MFTASHPSVHARAQGFAAAYARVGVETSVNSASAHKLIELLFNGFVESVVQARGAMRARQFEAKGKAISKAARIVEDGLRGALNLRAGGKLAQDLNDLYGYVVVRLTLANLRNDESILDECHQLINPLREAWISIGPLVESGKI